MLARLLSLGLRIGCSMSPLLATATPAPEPDPAVASYQAAHQVDEGERDPLRAAQLYRAHADRFPAGPYAPEARARAAYLEANAADTPQALAEFESVIAAWPTHPSAELLARMGRVARDFPRSPIHSRACFWLASERVRAGDQQGALNWLQVLLAADPPPKEMHRAELQAALIEQRRGHYTDALAIDRRYLHSDDPLAAELAKGQVELATAAQLDFWLYLTGLAWLGVLTSGLIAAIGRTGAPLRPLPFEVKLFAPVAALLAGVTVFEDRRVGLAVIGIAAGGGLLATLNGAYLRVVHLRGFWRLAYLGATGGAAISLAYCAVHGVELTDLVVTTLAQGADR